MAHLTEWHPRDSSKYASNPLLAYTQTHFQVLLKKNLSCNNILRFEVASSNHILETDRQSRQPIITIFWMQNANFDVGTLIGKISKSKRSKNGIIHTFKNSIIA